MPSPDQIPITIYVYRDPDTREPRYVGKTSDPRRRQRHHERRQGPAVGEWIRQLKGADKEPIFEVLEIASGKNWEEREKHWIKFYRDLVKEDTACDSKPGSQSEN
jgi:GIY-YIG catalytic domain